MISNCVQVPLKNLMFNNHCIRKANIYIKAFIYSIDSMFNLLKPSPLDLYWGQKWGGGFKAQHRNIFGNCFKSLLKKYNATVCNIFMQESLCSVDSKLFELWPPDQYLCSIGVQSPYRNKEGKCWKNWNASFFKILCKHPQIV